RRRAAAEGRHTGDLDARGGIAGDEIAGSRCRAADQVAGRVAQQQARPGVGNGEAARGVGADVVALDYVVGCSNRSEETADADARHLVTGDDVPRTSDRAADRVLRGAIQDKDAGARGGNAVANRVRAGGIDADIVAGDEVVAGTGKEEAGAAQLVAGDHIA